MDCRTFRLACLVLSVFSAAAFGQQTTGTGSKTGNSASEKDPIGNIMDREVHALSAQDFPERQAALKRLETLIAEQIRQRAEIQALLDDLAKDLAKQQRALAMVGDDEAQGQIAGLLEMERGLAGWTVQTMAEPVDKRRELLAWGLGKTAAPTVAKVYSQNRRARIEGIKTLAAMEGPAANWTLGRLINDSDGAVRASAMSHAWSRPPTDEVTEALWFRAITGPLAAADHERTTGLPENGTGNSLSVEFPEGEPMEFGVDEDAGGFTDALLASSVLVQLKSPFVESRIKKLIADREKSSKSLALMEDPDWTLATHRLVEAYTVKEAIPLLATEALHRDTQEMNGDFNGRQYAWSQRTMAIGVLCKLIGKDPADFNLLRANDIQGTRGWTWGIEINPQAMQNNNFPGVQDGPVVRAFYKWWKDHHAEYGVREEPSAAGVPPEPRVGRGRGGARRIDPAVDVLPLPVPPPE